MSQILAFFSNPCCPLDSFPSQISNGSLRAPGKKSVTKRPELSLFKILPPFSIFTSSEKQFCEQFLETFLESCCLCKKRGRRCPKWTKVFLRRRNDGGGAAQRFLRLANFSTYPPTHGSKFYHHSQVKTFSFFLDFLVDHIGTTIYVSLTSL